MLQGLPPEILQTIIGHLPTASAIINLSLTNSKLYKQISADDFSAFRIFVQNKFPSIRTTPPWKDAANILTSRSRAWDKRAFVARECCPPKVEAFTHNFTGPRQSFGYVPCIDSYETGVGTRSVLAWGAAGRLRLRVTDGKYSTWSSLRASDDSVPYNDILDLRLLRPNQRRDLELESVLLRRANGEISLYRVRPGSDQFARETLFDTETEVVDCMDISLSSSPTLATSSTKSLKLFSVHGRSEQSTPSSVLSFERHHELKHRKRCLKFLSEDTIAVGVQFTESTRQTAPIEVYSLRPEAIVHSQISATDRLADSVNSASSRNCATVIVPLTEFGGGLDRTFLSGWYDGIVRLYDMRAPLEPVARYIDSVDDGQILSLLPIGHERFLAGSSNNACLKTYDMRMPGSRPYSYLDASPGTPSPSQLRSGQTPSKMQHDRRHLAYLTSKIPARDINIFLALPVQSGDRLWQRLPREHERRQELYRGSVYSLSAPSPWSPRVYVGIQNHVIQLDYAASDDILSGRQGLPKGLDKQRLEEETVVLNLSCYERPRPGHESTDPILLRKQLDWSNFAKSHQSSHLDKGLEPGWDERWRVAAYDRAGTGRPQSDWRRGRHR